MGDAQNHHHQPTASRLGLRSTTGGEIVEVQGGHIVRSTGRKDRHSKVCTAKGPRDRRVRLSAHTAIQFYDVQDRLGYDRPSKAVDWLIKKAKSAIDELAELPAWKPSTNANFEQEQAQKQLQEQEEDYQQQQQQQQQQIHVAGPSSQSVLQMGDNNHHREPSFLPASMESDSIADTIKSFFPIGASAETNSNSSAMQFQSFQTTELLSRTNSHTQDLRLSLQSFQDPMLLYQHSQNDHHHHHQSHQQNENTLFSGTPALGFDWSENQQTEIGRFPRMVSWNAGGDTTGGGGGTFIFNSPPLFGQNQVFSQRGPLQSSNTPSIRAWMDPPSAISADHHHYHQNQTLPFHQSSMSGVGISEFTGFQIPARIQGEEEEHDGISDKPSSASSDSRH
ncbi:hypothetical protein LguiA_023063 [Lonicera macranthoides]